MNLRPHGPQPYALANCATSRLTHCIKSKFEMKTALIFEKEFTDTKEAWKFLNYLSSKSKRSDYPDLKLELENNFIRITLQKENPAFIESLTNYFKSGSIVAARLFCDGGSRGNPGPGASGFVILDETDKPIIQGGQFFEHCTNNYAEYMSLRDGVSGALEQKIKVLKIYMDSQLVVRQIRGEYKIKNKNLFPIYESIKADLASFQSYEISYIPRSHNRLADSLVNQILDQNI